MNGNAWEDLCVKCYRIRYQNENYTYIPAAQGGDAGIEGFTQNGIVHQCYCPEREYSDDELYAHQRDKLTKDIDKLLNNGERLKKLGVPTIVEWHFKNEMHSGNIEEFDGVSLVDWTDDNKIKSLKEFGCNCNNYNPYQYGDQPRFSDERANWF